MTLYRPMIWGAAVVVMLAGAVTGSAQSAVRLPADVNPDSLARLPYIQRKNLDEASQKIFDVLPGRRPDGALSGPLAFAAYNPGVAKALFDLHNAAVGGTLNAHVRELAILVACRETNYDLEWNAHEPSAVRAGIATAPKAPARVPITRRCANPCAYHTVRNAIDPRYPPRETKKRRLTRSAKRPAGT